MFRFFKKQSPVRIIALGFLATILLGSVLLSLPFSVREGISLRYIDALFTSTSAVCVTGLITVDAGTTFTPVGQTILALLIQIGGLGVSTIGAGIILAVGRKINLKGLSVIKEGSNLSSRKGLKKFVIDIFITTIIIELIGAILSFIVFIEDMNFVSALGVSIFHSIASFNNSGFDILGGINPSFKGQSLIPYQNNVLLNLTTSGLIILGGIGFLVIRDLLNNKFKWKKLSMHTKVVLIMSGILLVCGMLLLKLTEGNNISWLGAFFFSVSARTAGFSTYAINTFSYAGLLVLIILMFIGASPGSTGGGIKTTTFFAILQGIRASATNKSEKAFHYSMPKDAFKKASVITILGIFIVLFATLGISILEPHLRLIDVLLEATSAFGTVGLSTGITGGLSAGSKFIFILTMYIGRLGPLTIASIWNFSRKETFSYPEGNISIG